MKFYDTVTIKVQSWKWWDGAATGRREKYVAFWWPSWWDWWNWWSIIIEWSTNEYTLLWYKTNKVYKAKAWENGQWRDRFGKAADDVILPVPLWTQIYDADKNILLGSIETAWERCVVALWGKWWLWNKHFVDAQKQFSTIALLWEPHQKKTLRLELELLADMALVWAPSVGKSSLINAIANTKAQVAEYHFTTITPNLWIINHNWTTFSAIDIPWLIKWAHKGKWLWFAFLRHIIKSSLLQFVCALDRYEDGIHELITIINEFLIYCKEYSTEKHNTSISIALEATDWLIRLKAHNNEGITYFKKIISFLINKTDLVPDQEIQQEFLQVFIEQLQAFFKEQCAVKLTTDQLRKQISFVSAGSMYWIQGFLDKAVINITTLQHDQSHEIFYKELPIQEPITESIEEQTDEQIPKLIDAGYIQEYLAINLKVWYIKHPDICPLAYILPRWNDEAELWFWKQCADRGLSEQLLARGAKKWDILLIHSPYAHRDPIVLKRD